MRYNTSTHHRSLYWADRNGRWYRCDDLPPGSVDQVLQGRRPCPAARQGHRWPQPVRGSIVAVCRADHADQTMDMGTFGNPG